MGVEPTRYCYHGILNPARLPIPPRRRMAILAKKMVWMTGLEPARFNPHGPQPCASTNSATSTRHLCIIFIFETNCKKNFEKCQKRLFTASSAAFSSSSRVPLFSMTRSALAAFACSSACEPMMRSIRDASIPSLFIILAALTS